MGKKIFAAFVVAVCVGFAGYNVMQSQTDKNMLSDLLLANVEALAADDEVMDGHCDGTWNKECCVCGRKHYTYARPIGETCKSRTGCDHYK